MGKERREKGKGKRKKEQRGRREEKENVTLKYYTGDLRKRNQIN